MTTTSLPYQNKLSGNYTKQVSFKNTVSPAHNQYIRKMGKGLACIEVEYSLKYLSLTTAELAAIETFFSVQILNDFVGWKSPFDLKEYPYYKPTTWSKEFFYVLSPDTSDRTKERRINLSFKLRTLGTGDTSGFLAYFKPLLLVDDTADFTPATVNTIEAFNNDTLPYKPNGTNYDCYLYNGTTHSKSITVPAEGTWTIDSWGVVQFTPDIALIGSPTPLQYVLWDRWYRKSNYAVLTLQSPFTWVFRWANADWALEVSLDYGYAIAHDTTANQLLISTNNWVTYSVAYSAGAYPDTLATSTVNNTGNVYVSTIHYGVDLRKSPSYAVIADSEKVYDEFGLVNAPSTAGMLHVTGGVLINSSPQTIAYQARIRYYNEVGGTFMNRSPYPIAPGDWNSFTDFTISRDGTAIYTVSNGTGGLRLWKTTTEGASWSELAAYTISVPVYGNGLAILAADLTGQLLLVKQNGIIYKSVDGGASMGVALPIGIYTNVQCAALSSDGLVWVLGGVGFIHISTNGGISFTTETLLGSVVDVALKADGTHCTAISSGGLWTHNNIRAVY